MAFIGENRVKVNAEAAMQHLMDSEAPVESVESAESAESSENVETVEKEVEKEVPVDGENHEEVEL